MNKMSRRCEVVIRWTPFDQCDEPTTHYYPTQGGGSMALCEEHAKPHLPYVTPVAINPGVQKDTEYGA